ncbi:MAG: hypothetical protein ACLTXL_13160 [Clostridia bacterium]
MQANSAICINGDYCGAQKPAVLRDGVLYSSLKSGGSGHRADGSFSIITEEISARVLARCPADTLAGQPSSLMAPLPCRRGVGKAKTAAQDCHRRHRCLHYVFVVSTGEQRKRRTFSL